MTRFYYQIKGRQQFSRSIDDYEWAWPPIFSGMVEAEDRKAAKCEIEELYGRQFPLRVLKKDIEQHAYLLHIQELTDQDTYLLKRFQDSCCKECGTVFRLIDKYNDPHAETKSPDYCSSACQQAARGRDVSEFRLASDGRSPPVIYQVRQKSTGMSYVGQTTQPFTLRWWQHLSNPSGCKFHAALASTEITDWEFSVLEVVTYPDNCADRATYLNHRERHWIDALSAADCGFNTVRPSSMGDLILEVSHA